MLQDRGLDDTGLMRQRLERILAYRESPERWSAVYPHFPAVLLLVPHLHRAEHWQRRMREVAASMRVTGLVGAITMLPSTTCHGILLNPWLLSWRSLWVDAPCRLQEVLSPLPEDALPPGLLAQARRAQQELASIYVADGTSVSQWRRGQGKGKVSTQVWSDDTTGQPRRTYRREQETVVRLSQELGRRHLDLIILLANHTLLSTTELASILALRPASVQRYLRELCQRGCVTTWKPPEGAELRWYLAPRGLRLLAATQQVALLRVGKYTAPPGGGDKVLLPPGLELLQRYSSHLAGVYGFLAALHQSAHAQGHQVLWWETGSMCERSYRFEGVLHNLRPDAEFAYQSAEQCMRAWLEWDGGTMSRRDLAIKMHAYEQYIRSREWAHEGAKTLPRVLCVVPEKGQEERVMQAARSALAQTALIMHTTTATRLARCGPLAAIWRQVLPERCAYEDGLRQTML